MVAMVVGEAGESVGPSGYAARTGRAIKGMVSIEEGFL